MLFDGIFSLSLKNKSFSPNYFICFVLALWQHQRIVYLNICVHLNVCVSSDVIAI